MASVDKEQLWQELVKAQAEMDAAEPSSADYRRAKKRVSEIEKQLDDLFLIGNDEDDLPFDHELTE